MRGLRRCWTTCGGRAGRCRGSSRSRGRSGVDEGRSFVSDRDSSDAKPAKPVRPLRGVIVFALAVAPLVLLSAAWAQASRRSYYAAFFTPAGNVQGVASHGGQLLIALSNLSLGRERGLTM